MNELRPELPPTPSTMLHLPIHERGYPIPWFVACINGEYDFRVGDAEKLLQAVAQKLCWVCGMKMGSHLAFTVGPMCGINRTSAEPPAHKACAQYSAKACPFLSKPKMIRREAGFPESVPRDPDKVAGFMIERNPGVVLVWTTRGYEVIQLRNGYLFRFGDPMEIEWYSEGRTATRAEIDESVRTGLPKLWEGVERELPLRRLAAKVQLENQIEVFNKLLPAY
jgi:hypothetical protein